VSNFKEKRRTEGYTWTDYKTNAQIAKELKITSILDKLLEYKRTCKQNALKQITHGNETLLPNMQKESW